MYQAFLNSITSKYCPEKENKAFHTPLLLDKGDTVITLPKNYTVDAERLKKVSDNKWNQPGLEIYQHKIPMDLVTLYNPKTGEMYDGTATWRPNKKALKEFYVKVGVL
jgi:hypothetical protein